MLKLVKIKVGATGNLIKGHVMDVNHKKFTEALQAYDPQLYTKWNPKKLNGWGCWEIRRRPLTKVIVDMAPFEGDVICQLEYKETDILHHVLDCAFLNYDQIRKIKSMDTWEKDHWIHTMEYEEDLARSKKYAQAQAELKYAAKQHKAVFKEFYELVRSGKNPHRIVMGETI